jgi:hypothetical protein
MVLYYTSLNTTHKKNKFQQNCDISHTSSVNHVLNSALATSEIPSTINLGTYCRLDSEPNERRSKSGRQSLVR